ncbi:NUDIX hydrolase [archaeon]|nr:NUDIX hydrolase [archaeon]
MGKVNSNDKVIYEGHLTLVQRPNGTSVYDVVVSKDAAIMLYIDEEDYVHFTKQYRPAMEKEVLALPAETLDKDGFSPLEVMVEGLEEECGVSIGKKLVKYHGKLNSTDGHDTEYVHLFSAKGKGKYVGQRLEDTEKIEVVKILFEETYQMVLRNEIEGAKTGFLILREKLSREGAI